MFKSFTFPRQKTRFTCGPATLSAVAQLFGKPVDEKTIAETLDAQDHVGTSHEEMERWAKENLPVKSTGSNTYDKGLAIANIRNKDSGKGHYVLFLGRQANQIRYYCPLLGQTISAHEDEIDWMNGDGTLKNWSINFKIDGDYYDLDVEPQKHIFFLGNDLDELNVETDTSLLLQDRYAHQGIETSWHTPEDILIRGDVLYLSGIPVFKNDIVWLRIDPTNCVKYYTVLQQLCHCNAVFLNAPKVILTNNDKKLANAYREHSDIYAISSDDTFEAALRHLKNVNCTKFVVKPPNLFGGQDILITEDIDDLRRQAHDIIEKSGCAILEKYIAPSTPRQIDTSVIITWDRIIGTISREAVDDSGLTPYHCGSIPREIKGLSTRELRIVSSIQETMNQRGIFWAGLNFLEEELIEVNVSCPGGLRDINKIYGKNIEDEVINSARKYMLGQVYHHA